MWNLLLVMRRVISGSSKEIELVKRLNVGIKNVIDGKNKRSMSL